MSTTRLGHALPESTPPAPNSTSFRSSVVDTMVNTVAQCAIAALSVTTSAPMAANGSALAAVRFHTERPWPASIRRAAMASPIRPRPIQPTACDALLLMRRNLVRGRGVRCLRRSLEGESYAVHVPDFGLRALAPRLHESAWCKGMAALAPPSSTSLPAIDHEQWRLT